MSRGIWRRHLRSWLPALAFFLLNLGFLSVYRLVYAGEAQARSRLLEGRQAEVDQLSQRRRGAEELVARMRRNRQQIGEFRGQRLATEAERLTHVIATVKELARRAGVEPSTIRYPQEALEEVGLTKRSIVFNVEGDYRGVRRFINFLELSDLFLTLEEVSLSGRPAAGRLSIGLKLSTLFADEAAAAPAAAAEASS